MRKEDISDRAIATSGRTLDHAARFYDLLSPAMTFYQEGRISQIAIDLLDIRPGNRILDIGCGTGTLTIKIARSLSGLHPQSMVIGLDAAAKMIEVARKKSRGLKNIRFDVRAAERLPYGDGSFDAIISTFFFHHIDYRLKKMALRQIWRVLKKGAKAAIVDIDTPTNLFGAFCAWCGYVLFRQEEIKENIQDKLAQAIVGCGFKKWKRVSRHLGFVSVFELEK
ncbi:MAG: class I SAM-dependent methyltransferase [Candidatus Omnitrophota bacterium]